MKKNMSSFWRWYSNLKFWICLGIVSLVAGYTLTGTGCSITTYAEDYTDIFYVGVVDSGVNVRVAAGQNNDQVMHNGEKVQLKADDRVTIIGEEMVGDKVWYKVRFILDGEEIVGYCTSSYVTKTETTVTPTPIITTEPEGQKPMDILTEADYSATKTGTTVTPIPSITAEPKKQEWIDKNHIVIFGAVIISLLILWAIIPPNHSGGITE